MAGRLFLTFLLFLLILCGFTCGRLIIDLPSSSSDLISDGIRHDLRGPPLLRLNQFFASEGCEQTYGFMPCTTTAVGNLFLIIVYGYLMFRSSTYVSGGSELLLEILGPGIVGGLFLPMLGALPDAILILGPCFAVSGLSGSTETAQSQVSVGMGLLAGSTVMLLTLTWGACIVVGKCDLQDSIAIDEIDNKGFSLADAFLMQNFFCYVMFRSGVCTNVWTSYAARIMAISVIPFLIVQLPQALHSTSGRHLAVLIALTVSISLLIAYCLYQVFQPWIQQMRLAYAKHKHVMSGILKHLQKRAFGRLFTERGTPNEEVLIKVFKAIDENKDGFLSASELRALLVGIRFEEINLDHNDATDKVMKDFDASRDCLIDWPEFMRGITRWLNVVRSHDDFSRDADPGTLKYLDDFHERTKREHALLGGQSEETAEGIENRKWTSLKAVLLLLLGTVIAAAFADPLIDAVDNFSGATSIPTFFISFIALPLATSSEAVSAIIFASRKKLKSASLTFSALYGAVTMKNVLCLSVLLALVYVRGLTWDFSSEVLIILIVCIVMGGFASFRTTFPLWTSLVAFLLYPFSLALVFVLDYIFGWS